MTHYCLKDLFYLLSGWTSHTFLSQVPNPQRLVPGSWYERERPILREDQVPHNAFVAVEIKHGIAWRSIKKAVTSKRGSSHLKQYPQHRWHLHRQKQNPYLLKHSRFWSPRFPGPWQEADCCSLSMSCYPDKRRQILEVWVRTQVPTQGGHNWSSCLLGLCPRPDGLCGRRTSSTQEFIWVFRYDMEERNLFFQGGFLPFNW